MVIWDLLVFLCPFECEDVLCLKGLDESTLKKMVVELKFERKQEWNERARSLKLDQSDQSKS